MSEFNKTFQDMINSFSNLQKTLHHAERSATRGFREVSQTAPITPTVNDLWKHGSEYCFCYTGPKGELRLIYGDGATVEVRDYVIDGNEGYWLAWRGGK